MNDSKSVSRVQGILGSLLKVMESDDLDLDTDLSDLLSLADQIETEDETNADTSNAAINAKRKFVKLDLPHADVREVAADLNLVLGGVVKLEGTGVISFHQSFEKKVNAQLDALRSSVNFKVLNDIDPQYRGMADTYLRIETDADTVREISTRLPKSATIISGSIVRVSNADRQDAIQALRDEKVPVAYKKALVKEAKAGDIDQDMIDNAMQNPERYKFRADRMKQGSSISVRDDEEQYAQMFMPGSLSQNGSMVQKSVMKALVQSMKGVESLYSDITKMSDDSNSTTGASDIEQITTKTTGSAAHAQDKSHSAASIVFRIDANPYDITAFDDIMHKYYSVLIESIQHKFPGDPGAMLYFAYLMIKTDVAGSLTDKVKDLIPEIDTLVKTFSSHGLEEEQIRKLAEYKFGDLIREYALLGMKADGTRAGFTNGKFAEYKEAFIDLGEAIYLELMGGDLLEADATGSRASIIFSKSAFSKLSYAFVSNTPVKISAQELNAAIPRLIIWAKKTRAISYMKTLRRLNVDANAASMTTELRTCSKALLSSLLTTTGVVKPSLAMQLVADIIRDIIKVDY